MPTPEIATASLAITLFGPIQVWVQGAHAPAFRSRKSLWLLALLTLRAERSVAREWLAGTLWPEAPPRQAFSNLRPIVSDLRHALGPERERLKSPDTNSLLLDLTGAQVDVLNFDAAIARGTLSDLEQAVDLYGGSLLEGCSESWVVAERTLREQNCLHALQNLGDAALASRDYDAAVEYFRRAVGLDPWREVARRGWMEALAKSGDVNAALQAYRELVAFLRSDPSARPDAQTSALYRRLRAELFQRAHKHAAVIVEAAPVPRVQGNLSYPPTELVGRKDERLEVALQLRRSRLVTLIGVGGIGKTRLAQEVASEVVREYTDGVWLVALEALAEGRLVIQQIASVLGLREERGQTLVQRVAEHLRNKRLLLVLDNCEHLLESCAQVAAHLLQECGEVRILATSREALGVIGETVWSVPALAVPEIERLPHGPITLVQVLLGYESVRLFVERAQAVQKGFALNESNARLVAQVCRQLEGIPLAIELAAVRVRALTVAQIAARLNDNLGLLTGGSRTGPSRQQTLRATLDWSYDLLTEPERSLLKRLSVFAGGCLLEAAEQVCSIERLNADEVLDLLSSLVDKSLVRFEEREAGVGRYRLLEMVRQYAAESLQASGEAEQVKERHLEWCLTFAQQAGPALRTGEQVGWLTRLEAEHDNLRSALAWSLKNAGHAHPDSPIALLLCTALQQFWNIHGHLSEGRAWCERALTADATQERTEARAKALNGAGGLALRQGDYAAAQAYFEQSLAIQREIQDRPGIAAVLGNLGVMAYAQGDFAAAQAHFEQSLALQREVRNLPGIAGSLNNLGSIAKDQDEYGAARAYYEEALAINHELGNRTWAAINHNNLGAMAYRQGDYVVAQGHFEESLRIKRELGDRQGIASTLNNLGVMAKEQGDTASAQALYEESLAIRREIGDRPGIATSLHNLGNVATQQGEYPTARALHAESLGIKREIGDRQGIADSLEALAARIVAETSLVSATVNTAEASREIGAGLRRAARLWGAAQALREQIGAPLPPRLREERDRHVRQARSALGEEAFAAAWEEGRAMTSEQAVLHALEGVPV
jgi:predicted ATPase/DNA-binding SARP family transcriptional activator/Tfp pilus assembly protein PilF